MTALFVTGASGFVGRQVLAGLRGTTLNPVVCLTRNQAAVIGLPEWDARFSAIRGNLHEPSSFAAALPSGGTLIHLAGAVGKRRRGEFQRDNVDATSALLDAARAAGVAHVVYVSSIAATYPDNPAYPYGRSKRDAEVLVASSGIPFTILRPTIIFGAGSPAARALERLALLPVPLLIGSGRVEVQPVDVRDVARVIIAAAREHWTGETLDVGGPEVTTLAQLFAQIRGAHGLRQRPALHVPLVLARQLLAAAEPLLFPLLPVTAGQLAAFEYSSRATPHARMERDRALQRGLRDMIAGT